MRLALDPLESREVPAMFTVMTADDTIGGSLLSLRDAITLANADIAADTITFDRATFRGPTVTPQTSLLTGELSITEPLTIIGPGAPLLTLDGNANGRVFNIAVTAVPLSGPSVTIRGLGIANGSGVSAGAGILVDCPLTLIQDCDLFDNTTAADGVGGAIAADGYLSLIVDRCRIAGNAAGMGGGVSVTNGGSLTIRNSTLSNNVAAGTTPNGSVMAATDGLSSPSLTIHNSTIYQNSGATAVYIRDMATVEVISSIVSDTETSFANEDIDSDVDVILQYSAVGDASGFTLDPSSTNNLNFGTDLKLNADEYNGGPFETFEPDSGSPVLNLGLNPGSTSSDQRGISFLRNDGNGFDIGAVERQTDVVSVFDASDVDVEINVIHGGRLQTVNVDQISRVNDIDVYFANFYVFNTLTSTSAITLSNTSSTVVQTGNIGTTGRITVASAVAQFGIASSVRLTFDNNGSVSTTTGVEYHSLNDGRWTLAVLGTTATTEVKRLYGDSNGDLTVDGTDTTAFGNGFGTSLWYFDFNESTTIDGTDLTHFGNHFGMML